MHPSPRQAYAIEIVWPGSRGFSDDQCKTVRPPARSGVEWENGIEKLVEWSDFFYCILPLAALYGLVLCRFGTDRVCCTCPAHTIVSAGRGSCWAGERRLAVGLPMQNIHILITSTVERSWRWRQPDLKQHTQPGVFRICVCVCVCRVFQPASSGHEPRTCSTVCPDHRVEN